jgi:hypothetical protein
MPTIRCSRTIAVPAGDLPAITAALGALSDRETAERELVTEHAIDYTATLDVDDHEVVWTATFTVPDVCAAVTTRYRDTVFADFVSQLARTISPRTTPPSSAPTCSAPTPTRRTA